MNLDTERHAFNLLDIEDARADLMRSQILWDIHQRRMTVVIAGIVIFFALSVFVSLGFVLPIVGLAVYCFVIVPWAHHVENDYRRRQAHLRTMMEITRLEDDLTRIKRLYEDNSE